MSLAFALFAFFFFAENVWELVAAPSESLHTRQNRVENRNEASCDSHIHNYSFFLPKFSSMQIFCLM